MNNIYPTGVCCNATNKYNKVLEEAKIYANNIIRLDKINEYFMENINKEEIRKVLIQLEKEIDERRKI